MNVFLKVAVLVSSLLFLGTAPASPPPSSDTPHINIGIVFFYPPFVMSPNMGFDSQFIRLICRQLKTNCTIMPMEYHGLFTALDSKKIDIAIGGITIDSAASDNYIYSDPYRESTGEFLILDTNHATSLEALKGQKVGIMRGEQDGDVYYDYLNKHYNGFFTIVQYDNMEDLITALDSGNIAVAFTHQATANYWQLNGGDRFKILGNVMLVGKGTAIMSTVTNTALMQKINDAIDKIKKESIYKTLFNTYFQTNNGLI